MSKNIFHGALVLIFIMIYQKALSLAGELGTSSHCLDQSSFCTQGKSQGYCTLTVPHVKQFMQKYCKKSCGFCKDVQSTSDICADKSLYCAHGKKQGECESKTAYVKQFMQQNCRKTCALCTTKKAVCKDLYSSKNCEQYKILGYCDNLQYREYFTKYCQKTCKLCDVTKTYSCGIAKAKNNNMVNTIVGGKNAAKGNWPWQVAIYYKGKFKCGGTLVNTNYVISAAHCFSKLVPEDYKVVLGEHHRFVHEGTEQTVTPKRIILHPQYQPSSPSDIAVVELDKKAILTKYITPACLPQVGEELSAGKTCYMSGWGRLGITRDAASILQETDLKVISMQSCLQRNKHFIRKVTSTMICAGDAKNVFASGCHGDSGGPLVCENEAGRMVLQGVVSWGSPVCDSFDHYTVFTKVSAFKGWLNSIMSN